MFGARGGCLARMSVISAIAWGTAAVNRALAAESVVFDTDVLKARGIDPQLAEYFRQAPRFEQGSRRVMLEVNGAAKGQVLGTFDGSGDLCVDSSLLAAGDVYIPSSVSNGSGNDTCVLFTRAIPDAIVRLDPGKELISVLVPTHMLQSTGPTQKSFANGGVAGLINYDALAVSSQSGGQSSQYRSLATEWGMNAGDWMLRSRQTYTSFEGADRSEHLYAYAARTWEKYQTHMQLGQLTLAVPLFAGATFNGIQFQPDTALSALRGEGANVGAPVEGLAYSPSRIDVRQSGVVIYTTVVPAGPFVLRDLPLLSSNLDLEVTVREENGSHRQFTVPAASLRRTTIGGNTGYSLAVGQVRRLGSDDRETPSFATFSNEWLWGDRTQLSAGLMGASNYQSLGWGVQQALTNRTTVGVQQIISSVPASKLRGSQLQATLGTTVGSAVSASVSASAQSEGFRTLTDTAWDPHRERPEPRANQQLSASLNGKSAQFGTFGVVYSRNATANGQAQSRVGLFWSRAFREASLSVSLEKEFGAQITSSIGTAAYVTLSLPIGGRRSASTYVRHDDLNGMRTGAQLNEQVSDTLGYSVGADRLENGQVDMNGRVNLLPHYTRVDVGYSRTGLGSISYDAALRGGVAIHADGVTPSPYPLRDTFGLLKVGDTAGVKIRTSQGPVWTDAAGRAVAASLPAYRKGRIEIETASLPRSIDVLNGYQEVEAGRGSVQAFDFAVSCARRVLLTVQTADGMPVPQGLAVYDFNRRYLTTVVDDGKVFLLDAQSDMQLQLTLASGKRCSVALNLAQMPDSSALFETAKAICYEG